VQFQKIPVIPIRSWGDQTRLPTCISCVIRYNIRHDEPSPYHHAKDYRMCECCTPLCDHNHH
jgi:hypothetical protein